MRGRVGEWVRESSHRPSGCESLVTVGVTGSPEDRSCGPPPALYIQHFRATFPSCRIRVIYPSHYSESCPCHSLSVRVRAGTSAGIRSILEPPSILLVDSRISESSFCLRLVSHASQTFLALQCAAPLRVVSETFPSLSDHLAVGDGCPSPQRAASAVI